jgi:hypothetical protein
MGARDFELPAELEAVVREVCDEQDLPERRRDEIRSLVEGPVADWPACCGGSCEPCVETSKQLAREVLSRWTLRRRSPGGAPTLG